MLKTDSQLELNFSQHAELYNILISKDNFWRQLNDLIDFSFVVDMLKPDFASEEKEKPSCREGFSLYL